MHDHTSLHPVISLPEIQPAKRRRAHLQLWKILAALSVAPLLGAVLMTAGFYLESWFDGEGLRWYQIALSLCAPSLWSLVCGFAYLQTITRMRDQISRTECLLLGCASGFLMPAVMIIGQRLVVSSGWSTVYWSEVQVFSFLGLITLPFGLFGGWVFWRLGVRPATAPTTNYAPVFD